MKVTLKNGEIRECTAPTEQKIFKDGIGTGWLLSFSIKESGITSEKVDALITEDNVSSLSFSDDEGKSLFVLTGYGRLSSAIIRHGETRADIQIIKRGDSDND